MRFMVIVKATEDSENGVMPSEELLAAMGRYNEELVAAGIMQAGEGLHPSSRGVRVRFSGVDRSVIDGPFAETKEQFLGFFVLEAETLDEAIQFARELSAANPANGTYEIRPLQFFNPGVPIA